MNAWQAIVSAIEKEGIGHIFGLPGGDLFFDALYDHQKIKPILVREESSGVFMAMAYARITGKPGICYASSGPGVANLVPGIMEAESACVPIVAIAGSSSIFNAGMGAFQETDQISIMKPITKWTERVTMTERVPWIMRRAFSIACNGKPGPVFIEVPKDIGRIDKEIPEYVPSVYPLRMSGDPNAIADAVNLLLEAKRPVIVAGGGALSSKAYNEIQQLAEMLDIPIMTTPCGRSIISEDHPLAFGLVGLYFNKLGEKLYSSADLLMTIGSRNEEFQSGVHSFFPKGAKYIQIDIDPFEIGRNWIPDVPIVGDAKMILNDMIKFIGDCRRKNSWTIELLKEKERYEQEVQKECMVDDVPIKTKRVIWELNQVFGKDTVLVNENGSQDLWSYYYPYYKVLDINSCITPGEQTCMGFGVAGAI
ncbi:MAG: thiamine pyrophosphate-binding protein, partial [Candidatus Poribacteria bacterium]